MYLYSKIFLTFGTLQLIFEINGLESAGTQKEVYYGKVQGNVSLPCRVEALEDNTVDNRTILVNWKRDKLFLMSASIDDTGQLSLDYLDTAMETNGKYVVMEDFSLMVSSLNMKDATDYICTMVMYSDETKVKEVSRYENISTLLVQDVPSIPGSVVITDVFSRNCTITWEHSRNENFCPIKAYIIQIQRLPNIKDWNNARQITVQMTIKDTPSSVIEDLLPHQFYQARVIALNDVGLSTPSLPSAMFPTVSEVPSGAPTIVYAHSLKSTEITLQWNPPPSFEINGVLSGFEIGYGVDDIMAAKQIITEENENARNITIIKLKPYTFYVVWIRAVNDVGPGPPAEMMVKTAEGRPSKPRIIDVSKKTSMSMFVSWEAPQEMNGELKSYELMWTSNESIKPLSQEIAGQVFNTNRAYISNLLPYTSYKIKVRAITGGGPGEWSDMYPAVTDVSGPGPPLNVNLTVLGSYSIYVQWEKPKLFYRDVEKYIIEYTSPGDFFQSYQKVDASDEQVQEVNITSIPTNRVYQLRIAGITNSLYPDTTLPEYVGNYSEYFMFTLKGDNPNDTISDPSVESQDEEASSAGVIVGVISVIIVIIIAMIVIFISSRSMACRKCYRATFDYLAVPTNNNTPPTTVITIPEPLEEVTYTSVPVSEFLQHVKLLHADSDVGFSNEFNDIAKQTSGWNLKSDASNQPENASKNRYVNINAFDHSRVLLKPINGRMRSSDYINANYVDGYKRPKAYIATQGPLPQTFADFWRMVWEQNSVVIVMITKLVERGRKKCDQYWPDDGIEQYGPIQVKHLNTFSRAHYTVRMFSLKNTKIKKQYSERIVYHFHYTEWPDHGVPDFTLPVLKFVQKSAYINPPGAGPIVVHCSAGVGRTGTYILIDSMIEKIKEEKTINVPGFLLHIRRQRKFLVQTEEQYMLIHDALVEYILSHDTEIRHGDLTQYIQKLTSIHDGEVDTSLLRQWKLVTAFVPNETDKFSACRNVNMKKNRNKDFIPLSVKRVMLPAKPGIEGSDYINATYLQGYNKTNEFILTQHPIKESTEELESTKEDFWRMVWDQNSSVIFLLTDTDEEDFAPFWPSKEEPLAIDTGNFKVALRDEEEMARYKIREFILESTQDDYVLMTRIVTCDGWPHKDQPLHQAFDMIETIKELHKKNDIGPVIVVDRYGGIEGCVFCALWSLHDQQIHDKVVDIYHLCKLYHLKRPGIVGTQEDYLFLYQAMESFILDMGEKEMNNHNHYLHLKTSSAKRNGTMPRSPTLSNKETNV